MIYFFNRGLILEQEIVKALKKYFTLAGVADYYENFTISITNEHPFARMILSPEARAASRFPAIVVATEEDSKPPDLMRLVDVSAIAFEPNDFAANSEDGKSFIERRYEMITPKIMEKLRAALAAREDKRIFGTTHFIRRRDHVSLEIWAENPQVKNELYETIRLFVCGFMREYLAGLYKSYFPETGEGESPLTIFDTSVRGQRSNNYNVDFGIELSGAHITFDADYTIEQTVIDTELINIENIIMEVVNHARNYDEATRERIFGDDADTGAPADDSTDTDDSDAQIHNGGAVPEESESQENSIRFGARSV